MSEGKYTGRFAGLSTEEVKERTEDGRRIARFNYARERCLRIREGNPPFTREQLATLALIFFPAGKTDESR